MRLGDGIRKLGFCKWHERGQCETFGQLQVLDEARDHSWVRVRCRRCEHAWVIDDG